MSAAAYTCTASLEEIVYLAERGSIPAGLEVVARLGFEECRSRWGASPISREWEGSWFEPPRHSGSQWLDTDYYPWWSALVPPPPYAWDASDAD